MLAYKIYYVPFQISFSCKYCDNLKTGRITIDSRIPLQCLVHREIQTDFKSPSIYITGQYSSNIPYKSPLAKFNSSNVLGARGRFRVRETLTDKPPRSPLRRSSPPAGKAKTFIYKIIDTLLEEDACACKMDGKSWHDELPISHAMKQYLETVSAMIQPAKPNQKMKNSLLLARYCIERDVHQVY